MACDASGSFEVVSRRMVAIGVTADERGCGDISGVAPVAAGRWLCKIHPEHDADDADNNCRDEGIGCSSESGAPFPQLIAWHHSNRWRTAARRKQRSMSGSEDHDSPASPVYYKDSDDDAKREAASPGACFVGEEKYQRSVRRRLLRNKGAELCNFDVIVEMWQHAQRRAALFIALARVVDRSLRDRIAEFISENPAKLKWKLYKLPDGFCVHTRVIGSFGAVGLFDSKVFEDFRSGSQAERMASEAARTVWWNSNLKRFKGMAAERGPEPTLMLCEQLEQPTAFPRLCSSGHHVERHWGCAASSVKQRIRHSGCLAKVTAGFHTLQCLIDGEEVVAVRLRRLDGFFSVLEGFADMECSSLDGEDREAEGGRDGFEKEASL